MFWGRRTRTSPHHAVSLLIATAAALSVAVAVGACGDQHPAQISTGAVTLPSARVAPAPAPAATLRFVVNLGRTYLRVPTAVNPTTDHLLIGPGREAVRPYRGTGSGVVTAKVAKTGELHIVVSCVGGGTFVLENHRGRVITSFRPCAKSAVYRFALRSASVRSGVWKVRVRPRTRWSVAAITTGG